jgi:hypothetical protein
LRCSDVTPARGLSSERTFPSPMLVAYLTFCFCAVIDYKIDVAQNVDRLTGHYRTTWKFTGNGGTQGRSG